MVKAVTRGKVGGRRESSREMLKRIRIVLEDQDFAARLPELLELPPKKIISPLFGMLNHHDGLIQGRAVTAFGMAAAALAGEDLERARVVMRRLIWNLNDESGGIGWGAPEAMGEAMARHPVLAREYATILLSYIQEDGNRLDCEPLEEGALWGLERLLRDRPDSLSGWESDVIAYLDSPRPASRGLAARLLGLSNRPEAAGALRDLLDDSEEFQYYENGVMIRRSVSRTAKQSINQIQGERA